MYSTGSFYVAERLLSRNRSQMRSKCGKDKKWHMRRSRACHWLCFFILRSFVICSWTYPCQHGICLFYTIKKKNVNCQWWCHLWMYIYRYIVSKKQTKCAHNNQPNPPHSDISIHILHTVLCTFTKVLTRRICLTIKSFFSWWLFPSFSWHQCVIEWGYCKEKLDARHS